MADSKLTALSAVTEPAGTDLLYIVSDPGGSPVSNKIAVVDLRHSERGMLYVKGNAVAQSATGTTWVVLNAWSQTGSLEYQTTPSTAANTITVANSGIYLISVSLSISGSTGRTYDFAVFADGVQIDQLTMSRKLGSTDVGQASMTALYDTGGTDVVLDVRIYSDATDAAFTLVNGQFIVERVG